MSPEVSEKLTLADTGSNILIEPEPVDQHSTPPSPLADSPISQVPEQEPAASEEGTGVYDATQSTTVSCDQANVLPNVEIAPADRRQSAEVPVPTEGSQPGLPLSDGVEALQERLESMEQQFAGQ
jgi:hypothetical protein